MMVWERIAVAALAFAGLSIGLGLVIARILGSISAGLNRTLEDESWTSAPLTRAVEAAVDDFSPLQARRATHGSRTRT
jgi:xanthine dehydrogenase iron-sulfur cluster and FAD-binding subunit A